MWEENQVKLTPKKTSSLVQNTVMTTIIQIAQKDIADIS